MTDVNVAIGYVRVSTDEQQESVTAQEQRIRDYCSAMGYDLQKIVTDIDVSGKVPLEDRPNGKHLSELFVQKQAGQRRKRKLNGTTVIVTKLDRLGRNAYDVLGISNGAMYQGVNLVAILDRIDLTTPSSRFAFKIMAAVAEYEREVIGERTRSTMRSKISRNEVVGEVPYGWDRDGSQLVPNDLEHSRAEHMAARYDIDGWTFQQVADEANAKGWPSKKGGTWRPASVRHVINRFKEAQSA